MISTRILPAIAAFGLTLMALPGTPALADQRDRTFPDRPGVGQPVRFLGADGGAFQPRLLVISSPSGTVRAALPASTSEARSEDRIDLSETPLLGPLFEGTLSTAGARETEAVGTLFQAPGGVLLLDSSTPAAELTSLPVVLTTNLPRVGGVSYPLSRLSYGGSGQVAGQGVQIGTAHIIDGRLVLASDQGGPAFPSVEAMFRDLFE